MRVTSIRRDHSFSFISIPSHLGNLGRQFIQINQNHTNAVGGLFDFIFCRKIINVMRGIIPKQPDSCNPIFHIFRKNIKRNQLIDTFIERIFFSKFWIQIDSRGFQCSSINGSCCQKVFIQSCLFGFKKSLGKSVGGRRRFHAPKERLINRKCLCCRRRFIAEGRFFFLCPECRKEATLWL